MQKSYASPPWNAPRAETIISEGAGAEGALLPLLHALQAEFGCVPDDAVPLLATALNLSRAEVHGVLTFYHDFRRTPGGRRILKLCRAEACQARGGREVEAALEDALGLAMGQSSADGAVTLEAAYCLGLCASGPAALLDGAPVARLAGARLTRLIDEIRQ
jgi:formate dehydrogenase subunit gamma